MEILAASWVLPINGPPLRDGRVAVEDERITWVGRSGDAREPKATVRDLGVGVLLPGLVNAHCHLELSCLRGRLDPSEGFTAWVEALLAMRSAVGSEAALAAVSEAIRGLERAGTAAVGDVSNTLMHLDLLAASRLAAIVFYELIGWDSSRASGLLAAAETRLSALPPDLAARGVEVRLAAHAPHSVGARLLAEMARRGGPAAIHLAESPAERRFLLGGDSEWREFLKRRAGEVPFTSPRMSPVRYAESLGVLHPRLVAAHGVQVDADDLLVLARRGVHVAVCPRSNRALGVGRPPVPEMLAAGVRLCLGTDSLASVPSLDLMDDVVALHREFPALDPAVIVRMATADGAEALGLGALGTIAPGKRAALAYAPADRVPEDPSRFLVSGEARLRRIDA